MVSSGLCHSLLHTYGTNSEGSPDMLSCPSLFSLFVLGQGCLVSAGPGGDFHRVTAWKALALIWYGQEFCAL